MGRLLYSDCHGTQPNRGYLNILLSLLLLARYSEYTLQSSTAYVCTIHYTSYLLYELTVIVAVKAGLGIHNSLLTKEQLQRINKVRHPDSRTSSDICLLTAGIVYYTVVLFCPSTI